MKNLTRFFAVCLLVVSISTIALADGDGGNQQTPPTAPPMAQSNTEASEVQPLAYEQPAEDPSVDFVTTAEMFAAWLALSIL